MFAQILLRWWCGFYPKAIAQRISNTNANVYLNITHVNSRSHIASHRSATSLRPKFLVVAGLLHGGRRLVADRLQKAAGTIWSQGGFGCCKWDLSATKSIVERFLLVADRLPTGRQLVADWSPTNCSSCRQSQHSFSRRLIAHQSPIGCRPISKKLQTFCNQKQTLKILSQN